MFKLYFYIKKKLIKPVFKIRLSFYKARADYALQVNDPKYIYYETQWSILNTRIQELTK